MTYPNRPDKPLRPRNPRKPQPIGTFTDCHQVWETALRHGELKIDYPSLSPAIAMRQRMNTYRVLLRQRNADAYPGAEFESPYDHLQIALRGTSLIIAMKPTLVNAKISLQDGTVVPLVPYIPIEGSAPAAQLSSQFVKPSDDDLLE